MAKKLKLLGFKQDPSTPRTSGADKEYEVLVSPSAIKHKKGMLFNTDNRANGSIDVKQWKGYDEETLNVELALDGTGYATGDGGSWTAQDVEEQVTKIMEVIYDYDGGTHKPMYVVITWNNYAFLGHVKNLETEYKVFDQEGKCIVANISIELTIHMDNETAAKKQNRNSPDMSHLQVIKDGDKIPLICNDIYDDPTYYVQIAELNGLTNFRNVSIGKKLLFPPLIND
jgi:hypothetical protein